MNLRLSRGRLGGVTANEVQRILVDESGLQPNIGHVAAPQ
jgi:hypothetical protein